MDEDVLPPKRRLRRPRLVVVIGLWMLCFPTMILSAFAAVDTLFNYSYRSNFFVFWVTVGVFTLTASLLYGVTRNYLKLPAMPKDLSARYSDSTTD